jgi:hypothetical protein
MHEERDAVLGQVAGRVPARHDCLDVNAVAFADGDQRAWGDECGELVGGQLRGVRVEANGVRGQERMIGVTVQFGPLVGVDGVFDR